jgi:hypothetical protein
VLLSGVIKHTAVKLTKICNDLRMLASGPRCGFNEINLPQMQPGSSIMPGKVNPVIPEVVNQTSFLVIGLDLTVTLAASAGQLQLNVMEPVITFALFASIATMERAVAQTGHLVGDTFTLADMNLMPILYYMNKFPESSALLAACPKLKAYFERHAGRKSVQDSMPQSQPGTAGNRSEPANVARAVNA